MPLSKVGKQPHFLWLPAQSLLRQRTGTGIVKSYEMIHPAEVSGRLLYGNAAHRKVQPRANRLCDVAKWHTFVGNSVKTRTRLPLFQSQKVKASRIEPVNTGPAIAPITHIRRETLLTGNINQHRLFARGYAVSKPGVAIADKPTGPFTFLEEKSVRPVPTSTFRDMNLWVDDDGKAYVYYSGEDNWTMHISRLNDDYTAPEKPMVAENEGKTWSRNFVRRMREAPAPFKWQGKYYIITSACTGWEPNPAGYAVADSPLGPWKELGNPCVGDSANTTFHSQSTYVLPLGGDRFMYMGDRWKSKNLADSRYIWLPFTMKPDGTFNIEWTDAWTPTTK